MSWIFYSHVVTGDKENHVTPRISSFSGFSTAIYVTQTLLFLNREYNYIQKHWRCVKVKIVLNHNPAAATTGWSLTPTRDCITPLSCFNLGPWQVLPYKGIITSDVGVNLVKTGEETAWDSVQVVVVGGWGSHWHPSWTSSPTTCTTQWIQHKAAAAASSKRGLIPHVIPACSHQAV